MARTGPLARRAASRVRHARGVRCVDRFGRADHDEACGCRAGTDPASTGDRRCRRAGIPLRRPFVGPARLRHPGHPVFHSGRRRHADRGALRSGVHTDSRRDRLVLGRQPRATSRAPNPAVAHRCHPADRRPVPMDRSGEQGRTGPISRHRRRGHLCPDLCARCTGGPHDRRTVGGRAPGAATRARSGQHQAGAPDRRAGHGAVWGRNGRRGRTGCVRGVDPSGQRDGGQRRHARRPNGAGPHAPRRRHRLPHGHPVRNAPPRGTTRADRVDPHRHRSAGQ